MMSDNIHFDALEIGGTLAPEPRSRVPSGPVAGEPKIPPTRRGFWFEEFEPGLVVESPGRTITEADVVNFAGLSGDYTELHTNEEYASATPFRHRIAHGMLVQAIATGLGVQSGVFTGTIQALADMTIHWRAPVFPGDTIRLVLEVDSREDEPSRRSGLVGFKARVVNQEEKVVSDGHWQTRILRRPVERSRSSAATGDPR